MCVPFFLKGSYRSKERDLAPMLKDLGCGNRQGKRKKSREGRVHLGLLPEVPSLEL